MKPKLTESLQAAQRKQEMKAEETGSARRMFCQFFMHSRWKDSMGDGGYKGWWGDWFHKSHDEDSLPQKVVFSENIWCYQTLKHRGSVNASPLLNAGGCGNKTQARTQFRHRQNIWYSIYGEITMVNNSYEELMTENKMLQKHPTLQEQE